jgi:6-phosphofructokinase 1
LLCDATLRSYRAHAKDGTEPLSFELAGPRERIYFDPAKTRVAMVTCGGLCPGLNNVIRSLVLQLWHRYGVRSIYGVRYGYQGFISSYGHPFVDLNPEEVLDIHQQGGSLLGSSRGAQPVDEIVDCLERHNINILFAVGGDGTLRGAQRIQEEVQKRGLKISVVGVPKTIDNDIPHISRTFGHDTAVDQATQAICAAHVEAKGAPNGVGIVKLMGRHSGYIACKSALAMREVNVVLVPEQRFELNGGSGLFAYLEKRLRKRGHAVIVVAEGAGQDLFLASEGDGGEGGNGTDASGNVKLHDIGVYLSAAIKGYFRKASIPLNLKYIDPSYIIRAAPANSKDAIFCNNLAEHAAHAAMAGKTGMVVGLWHEQFTHLPLAAATSQRKVVSLEGELWRSTVESTGQPPKLRK